MEYDAAPTGRLTTLTEIRSQLPEERQAAAYQLGQLKRQWIWRAMGVRAIAAAEGRGADPSTGKQHLHASEQRKFKALWSEAMRIQDHEKRLWRESEQNTTTEIARARRKLAALDARHI